MALDKELSSHLNMYERLMRSLEDFLFPLQAISAFTIVNTTSFVLWLYATYFCSFVVMLEIQVPLQNKMMKFHKNVETIRLHTKKNRAILSCFALQPIFNFKYNKIYFFFLCSFFGFLVLF